MVELATTVNRIAETWFSLAFHLTWQSSLLAMLLLAVVWLGRRWPSPLRYWLLVLALAKFTIPPLLTLPTGLFTHVGPVIEAAPAPVVPSTHPASTPIPVRQPAPMGTLPIVPMSPSLPQIQSPAPLRANDISRPVPPLTPQAWGMLVHLAGALSVASGSGCS